MAREQAVAFLLHGVVAALGDVGDQRAAAHAERDLDGLRDARADAVLHDHAVDHHLYVVDLVAVELHALGDLLRLAVGADARETLLRDLLEQVAVVALAAAHDGRQDAQPRAGRHRRDGVDDLVVALPPHRPARDVGIRFPGACVEQTQEVVDLRDRTDGASRVAAHRLLLDGDHRAQPVDVVHVRALHHTQELTRVGAQALHVAALALGVDRVEGETGLAAAAQAGHHDERVARDVYVEAFEVVLARAADRDLVVH